jgi:NitT/TauT family transport system substrate-binding protein
MQRRRLIALAATALAARPADAAETGEVRLSHGFGILYLPLIVMRDRKLLEQQLAQAGLPQSGVSWQVVDGGNVINDAMLAGALDIAGTGAPGFITLWAKARGVPRAEVVGLRGLSTCALSLNTNRPGIRTLADFGPNDKIALPGIKTSLSAIVLQMLVAQRFGKENYAKLDPITVSLSHPDAYAALMGGGTEVAAHFGSPPYSILELRDPRIHRVIAASEVLGPATLDVVYAPRRFVDANPATVAASWLRWTPPTR